MNIKFDQKANVYECIISDNDKQYESDHFTLQSAYQEGIIQDCTGEVSTHKFFNSYGAKNQIFIKNELKKMLN